MSWAATLAILIMYLTQRMRLTVAISSFGILTQLAESARIVYVAMERPDGFEETIVFNLVISLALIIYMVMAAVRHALRDFAHQSTFGAAVNQRVPVCTDPMTKFANRVAQGGIVSFVCAEIDRNIHGFFPPFAVMVFHYTKNRKYAQQKTPFSGSLFSIRLR